MSDIVVDSSVVAKWILPEADSDQAQQLIAAGSSEFQLVVLDLVFPEVANAIWKRCRRRLISADEAREALGALLSSPVRIEPSMRVLGIAIEIAVQYDRSVYDALFVALATELGARGVTADVPLFTAVQRDFPAIVLLRDF